MTEYIPTSFIEIGRLREVLTYCPETGDFTWNDYPSRKGVAAGKIAGAVSKHAGAGYRVIRIDKTLYYGHRLAWFWMTEEWALYIDHINGIGTDNRWVNLRKVTMAQNMANSRKPHNNTSGYKGAWYDKNCRTWRACYGRDGQTIHLPGKFETAKDAHEAYMAEVRRVRGAEYARAE